MKKPVNLSVAVRKQMIEDTVGMMELDQAMLDSVFGGSGKTSCAPVKTTAK